MVFDAVERALDVGDVVFDFGDCGVEDVFYAVRDVVEGGEVDTRLEGAARELVSMHRAIKIGKVNGEARKRQTYVLRSLMMLGSILCI